MKNQNQQLTSAADNALRLLDQMAKLEPFELSSAARELVRDASAPLRNALHGLTMQPQTGDQLLQGRIDAAFLWLKAGHRTQADKDRYMAPFFNTWPGSHFDAASAVLQGDYSRVSESAVNYNPQTDDESQG